MSYNAIQAMCQSPSLKARITACAAMKGRADAYMWVEQNIWGMVPHMDGWAQSWDHAEATKDINVNQDTGARTDVIPDAEIVKMVQAYIASIAP